MALPGLGQGGAAWHLWLGWRLFHAVRAWRPDVAHVFKPKGPSGLAGAMLWAHLGPRRRKKRRTTKESVVRPASLVIRFRRLGGCWRLERRSSRPATAVAAPFFCLAGALRSLPCRRLDGNERMPAPARHRFGANPERVFILHNGIEAPSLPAASFPQPASSSQLPASVILYTRFAGTRPADVGAIWARLRARMPGAELTVVGRGLRDEERELTGMPGITLQGWIEPAELPRVLDRMSVAIVPWGDTPPNRARHSAKVLELMAAGLPIVAYAVGELPVTLGEAGVLGSAGRCGWLRLGRGCSAGRT